MEDHSIVASIPYVRGLSEGIRRLLAKIGILTALHTNSIKWRLMGHAKDKIPKTQRPGMVYATGCQECPKVYVGETLRTAQQKVKEH